jgi:hypothetical protein
MAGTKNAPCYEMCEKCDGQCKGGHEYVGNTANLKHFCSRCGKEIGKED